MNTTPRPNFALVCIAVVLLSFSFAGDMLCSSLEEATPIGPFADTDVTVQQLLKSKDDQAPLVSQVSSAAIFTSNILATNGDRHILSPPFTVEMGEDNEWIIIDSIQQLNAEAVEASSSPEPAIHNYQVAYDLNYVANNNLKGHVMSTKPAASKPAASKSAASKSATSKSATSKSRPSISKMAANKSKVVAIAVSAKPSIYSSLLPSHFGKQAQLKLQQAVMQVNLGDNAKNKLKLALLEGDSQDLIELEQEEAEPSITEDLIDFLKGLAGCSTEEKIYVLKGLSEKKIEALKQILNAHNIKLRAFIMS